jgi:hypothetical protein
LRKPYLVHVLQYNFRKVFDGPRWRWIATLFGITFDVVDATEWMVDKLHRRAYRSPGSSRAKNSRTLITIGPADLDLKK